MVAAAALCILLPFVLIAGLGPLLFFTLEICCIVVFLASFQHLCLILKTISATFVLSKYPGLFLNVCQWISGWMLLRALKERSAFIKFVVRKLDVHKSALRVLIDA